MLREFCFLSLALAAGAAAAQTNFPQTGLPPQSGMLSFGVGQIAPPSPQNLQRPAPGARVLPPMGSVFCNGGDIVFSNGSPTIGARNQPCPGPLYVLVCNGPIGQYGVYYHEFARGELRPVATPRGSSFDAQCGAPPKKRCPAKWRVGGP